MAIRHFNHLYRTCRLPCLDLSIFHLQMMDVLRDFVVDRGLPWVSAQILLLWHANFGSGGDRSRERLFFSVADPWNQS